MNWIWTILGQKPRLEKWENRSFSPGVDRGPIATDHVDVYERDVGREEPGPPLPDGLHRRLAGEILDYHIFPPTLVTSVCRRRPVAVGDAVGICYHFVPGLDLFFAARVIACFDEQAGDIWRTGFTYRTLHGHPECGEETFSAEKNMETGEVRVAIRAWSRPGTWLSRLASPLTRALQVRAGNAAVEHLLLITGRQTASPRPPLLHPTARSG